jgi:hypothetical protein
MLRFDFSAADVFYHCFAFSSLLKAPSGIVNFIRGHIDWIR